MVRDNGRMQSKGTAWIAVTMLAASLLASRVSVADAGKPGVDCKEEIWATDPKIRENVREDMSDGKPHPGLKPPEKTGHVLPEYPKEAVKQGLAGRVVVTGRIEARTGRLTALRAEEGPELLAKATLKAAEKWRYRPLVIDKVKYDMDMRAEVSFTLK